IIARAYDGVEAESIAYYQEDPTHPDAPVFDFDEDGAVNYFDVTNKMIAQPTSVDFGDGWGPQPSCWLLYQTHTDCAAAEITVRASFMRTEADRGYQPTDYSGDRQERFGYFVNDRPGYDPEYGVVEPARSFFINRHDIWEESYRRDADGALGPCMVDADCGGGGSVCDEAVVRGGISDTPACTLPYRERTVRPIAYHVSEAFPEELLEDARWVGAQWNQTFVETVASLRENECRAAGGDAGACAAERDREDGQTAFVICDNPVADGDHGACGEPGTVARVGDMRYSLLGWEPEPAFGVPLGFGPSNTDPETGEIVTGQAWVYGAGVEQLASYGRDIIALLNGDLESTDLIAGENVERWVASLRARDSASMRTADRHVIAMDGADAPAANAAMGLDRLGDPDRRRGRATPRTRGQMAEAMRAARRTVLRGDGGLRHDDGRTDARLHALRDTSLEALMAGPQMRFAAGIDPAAPLDDAVLDRASPLRQMSPAHLRRLQREKRRLAGEHCVLRAEDFSDQGLIGLAQTVRDAVETGDGTIEWYGRSYDLRADGGGIDYDAVRRMLRHPIFASTAAHELGHTLGLRHNFSGSYDSLNYSPRYWALRDDGSMGPRAYDPITSAETQGRIREYQYSTVMDYGNNFLSTDAHGLGHYDHAAIKMGYGDLVEVFEDAANPAELAWVHFSQLFGWPVALDSNSFTETGRVEAHTYTEIPALAGGIAALENRSDVPYASLVADATLALEGIDTPLADAEGRPVVPYRFCSDEVADLIPDCSLYDAGADQYEVIQSILDTYWSYYLFNNFRRERLGFDVDSVYCRLYWNYFSKLLYQNQDYVFNRLFLDEIFLGDPTYDDFYEREDGMGAYTAGIAAAFSMLTRIIAAPEPGDYVEYDD
ncbi:MAG: zinc-dependent metalloprotease, partial [Deltaproteobacteria bacterium]|nr:zinc-dependent metalloprotease [Deltaproteobacteria bacterium]